MSDLNAEKNKAIVLEAFDTLFNKRDYTGGGAVLVSQLHSTQRPYRAGTGRAFQPHQGRTAVAQV